MLKLKGLIFCYVLIIHDHCYGMNLSALNTSESKNEMFASRMLKKYWPSTEKCCYLNNAPSITDFPTLPQTFKKRFSILKHKNSTTVRDKRTVSIPPLTYYHSKFRMNLIRKEPKKESTRNNKRQRQQRRFLQMVQSLPIEHRYKFGIPAKDCRYDMCNITGKIFLNDTLMLIAMTVCFKLI